jgi:hypothetical protein
MAAKGIRPETGHSQVRQSGTAIRAYSFEAISRQSRLDSDKGP